MTKTRGIHKATGYLQKLMQQAKGTVPVRLPTEKYMAADAGVAIATMHKAVRRFVDAGLLAAAQRRGIFTVPAGRSAAPLPVHTPVTGRKFERLAHLLEHDLLTGVAGDPARETLKRLAARYGANVKTIRKALGLLQRGTESEPVQARQQSTLIVYGSGTADTLEYAGATTLAVIRRIEEECFRRNLALRTRSFEYRTGVLHHPRSETPDDRAALGYVIIPVAFQRPVFDDLVARLVRRGKPVVVIDETGEFEACLQSGARYFSIATSREHGRKMGEFLYAHGHRTIAYVSLFSGDLWSNERQAGICGVFEAHGGTVVKAVLPSMSMEEKLVDYDRSAAPVREILELSYAHQPAAERQYLDLRTRTGMQDMFLKLLLQNRHRARLIDVFKGLLGRPDITVWACANDLIAIEALHFLRREKRDGDISVTGFDNSPESFLNGLTTFSFEEQAVTGVAFEYIMHGARRYKSAGSIKTMPGHVVERQSVKRIS